MAKYVLRYYDGTVLWPRRASSGEPGKDSAPANRIDSFLPGDDAAKNGQAKSRLSTGSMPQE